MHHIYCFSGLGADGCIFKQLTWQGAYLHVIRWTMPAAGQNLAVQKNEPCLVQSAVSPTAPIERHIAATAEAQRR